MISFYHIQVIVLDKIAYQALDLVGGDEADQGGIDVDDQRADRKIIFCH